MARPASIFRDDEVGQHVARLRTFLGLLEAHAAAGDRQPVELVTVTPTRAAADVQFADIVAMLNDREARRRLRLDRRLRILTGSGQLELPLDG